MTELLEAFVALKTDAEGRAAALRAELGGEAFVVSSVVWGAEYCGIYMRYLVRSLLAPGNLPALAGRALVFSICTTAAGRKAIEGHPNFAALSALARIEFFEFPEALTGIGHHTAPNPLLYHLYGTMDHVSIFFAKALGAHMLFFPVDCVVADGSVRALLRYLEQGYEAVGATNLVAKRETFLPALDARFGDEGPIVLTPKELATLGYACRHQYTEAGQVKASNASFAKWPRDFFWPKEGGLAVRALFLHPLCVSARALARGARFNYKRVDFQFTASLFPTPDTFRRFKVLETTADVYINDCTTERRVFPTTGRPFDPAAVARETGHAKPLHRWIAQQPQFIVLDGIEETTDREPDADVAAVLDALRTA